MRRRWIERLKGLVVYAAVSVFVLLAVGATALRLVVAYAPELRAETETYLGEWLGRPVSIGGLRAEWQGLDPRLIFEDVTVEGDGSSRYSFGELEVALSARALLTEARIRPSEVAVSGVELTLERLPGGKLEMSANRAPAFLTSLPARIRVTDAVVRIIDHVRADVYALTGARLLFSRKAGDYRLSVTASLPAFMGERAEFVLRWKRFEDPFADARLYANLSGMHFDALESLESLGSMVRAIPGVRGVGDAELWLQASDGRVDAVSGRIGVQGLGAKQSPGDWFDIGQRLEARFDWRSSRDGWALDVDEIAYAVEKELWPISGLSLRYQRETADQPERWRAGVEYIELSRLRQLLANLPRVPEALREWAGAVSLGGELRQAGFQVARRDGEVLGYAASGTLTGAHYTAPDGRLAASGIDASFTANEGGGEARINGRDGELVIQRLFRRPLSYSALEAEAAWARDSGGWRLGLSGLSLRNADGAVSGSARLYDLGSGNPFLDIHASAQRFDAAATGRYLPTGIMEPDLVDWLDQAFLGGRLGSAELQVFGRLEDFPFPDPGKGVFEIRASVNQARFSFFPEWPDIRELSADLHFSGLGMRVTARQGRIFDVAINEAVAEIESFREAHLSVDGQAAGPGDDFLAFLRQAPITRKLAPKLAPLRLSGRHRLDIGLWLPLKRIRDSRVDGNLQLSDGTLSLADREVRVSALQGAVRFNARGLEIDDLTGQWRGEPVHVEAVTRGQGDDTRILLTASLSAGMPALMPSLQSYADGRSRWRAEARLPGFAAGDAVDRIPVEVRSDLVGMAVDLPRPLGKDADVSRPVRARLAFTDGGLSPITLHYGNNVTVRAALGTGENGEARYGIRFGDGDPELPEGQGLRITGHLQRLVLDGLPSLPGPGAAQGGGEPLRIWVNASVGRLAIAGQTFPDIGVLGTVGPQGLSLRFSGRQLAGDVSLPTDGRGSLSLERLYLSKEAIDLGGEAAPAERGEGDAPSSLDVSVGNLYLEGQRLGRFTALLRTSATETLLQRFRLDNEVLKIQGSGGWRHTAVPERSWLKASFDSPDVGRALALFGYAKTVDGGESHGRMRLEWPGGPLSLAPEVLKCDLEFTLRDGRLPAVEPGAGRVFGLLSLATIPRRLTLDFSDIFEEGFSFDRIKADFHLENGIATPKQFFIEGPAARIDFSGEIDLVERRFDQILTVTPQVSSALPLIGGLAGGPVAAAVLFVTQQIFQDDLDRIARYRYRVTGPWRDPDIEPIRPPPSEAFSGFPNG